MFKYANEHKSAEEVNLFYVYLVKLGISLFSLKYQSNILRYYNSIFNLQNLSNRLVNNLTFFLYLVLK